MTIPAHMIVTLSNSSKLEVTAIWVAISGTNNAHVAKVITKINVPSRPIFYI